MRTLSKALYLFGLFVMSASAHAEAEQKQAIASFGKDVVKGLIEESWVPGIAVAVVDLNNTLLLEGYGTANVATGVAVDPVKTSFQIGSIAKVFIAVAALKLEADGRFDLDADLNNYLGDIRIPKRFNEPVTARHVLTHTSGFDATISRTGPLKGEATDAWISRRLMRVREAGSIAAYDNIGFGVLGLALANVEGLSVRGAMKHAIFDPLGMKTVGDERLRAACHTLEDAGDDPVPCKRAKLSRLVQGAGDAEASAHDMAVFMKTLLTRDPHLLPYSAYSELFNFEANRLQAGLPSVGLGMQEFIFNGQRGIGHGGMIDGFISQMVLFPKSGLGIFVVVNGGAAPGIMDAEIRLSVLLREYFSTNQNAGKIGQAAGLPVRIINEFVKRFVHHDAEQAGLNSQPKTMPVSDVEGRYIYTRNTFDHLFGKVLSGGPKPLYVKMKDANTLDVGRWGEYQKIGPLLFENPKKPTPFPLGAGRIAFKETPSGMVMGLSSVAVFARDTRWPSLLWLPLVSCLVLGVGAGVMSCRMDTDTLGPLIKTPLLMAVFIIVGILLELEFGFLLTRVDQHLSVFAVLWRVGALFTAFGLLWEVRLVLRPSIDSISYKAFVIGGAGLAACYVYWFILGRLWAL